MTTSLFNVVVHGAKIAYRSMCKTLWEEVELSREAARIRYAEKEPEDIFYSKSGITLPEAMRILNIDKLDPVLVEKQYKFLFNLNSKENGGSFYLQSKIFRAKKQIDFEIAKVQQTQKLEQKLEMKKN